MRYGNVNGEKRGEETERKVQSERKSRNRHILKYFDVSAHTFPKAFTMALGISSCSFMTLLVVLFFCAMSMKK